MLPSEFYQAPPLKNRFRGSFNGLSSCVPFLQFLLPAEQVRKTEIELIECVRQGDEQAIEELNKMIITYSSALQESLCRVFDENPATSGMVHGLNGSELLAEVNARVRYDQASSDYAGKVLTYLRGGRLVNKALAGGDIREDVGVNFTQAVGLLTPPKRVRDGCTSVSYTSLVFLTTDHGRSPNLNDGYRIEDTSTEMMFDQKGDDLLLEEVADKVRDTQINLAVIPVADALGRIWPWKDIAHVIDHENAIRKARRLTPVFKILNAVQAVGRVSAEDIQKPLDYYDAVITVGHKGLGAMMNSAVLLAKRAMLERLYAPNKHLPWYITEFSALHRCPNYCYQDVNEMSGTISVPEIQSFKLALDQYYVAGMGKTFSNRRSYILKKMDVYRRQLMFQLDSRYFNIFESNDGLKLTPSVVCIGLQKGDSQLAQKIKNEAMQRNPAVILSGNVGPVLRLAIPEHLSHSVDILSKMIDTAATTLNSIAQELNS